MTTPAGLGLGFSWRTGAADASAEVAGAGAALQAARVAPAASDAANRTAVIRTVRRLACWLEEGAAGMFVESLMASMCTAPQDPVPKCGRNASDQLRIRARAAIRR